jgi:hypothetical protein
MVLSMQPSNRQLTTPDRRVRAPFFWPDPKGGKKTLGAATPWAFVTAAAFRPALRPGPPPRVSAS